MSSPWHWCTPNIIIPQVFDGYADVSSESATIEQIKARHEVDLMKIPGVEGVALGELRGRAAIVVYVRRRSQSLLRKIPASLEGFPVAIEVSGRFVAR